MECVWETPLEGPPFRNVIDGRISTRQKPNTGTHVVELCAHSSSWGTGGGPIEFVVWFKCRVPEEVAFLAISCAVMALWDAFMEGL